MDRYFPGVPLPIYNLLISDIINKAHGCRPRLRKIKTYIVE